MENMDFVAPVVDMDLNRTITLPLHSLGKDPLIKVTGKETRNDRIVVTVSTPRPLFFSGNFYAYNWNYKTSERFAGNTMDECLRKAKEWANYLLNFQEETCYAATGPVIEH